MVLAPACNLIALDDKTVRGLGVNVDLLRFGKGWMAATVAGNMAVHLLGVAWAMAAGRPELVAAVGLAGYMHQQRQREGESPHAVLLRAAGDACVEDVHLAALLEAAR